MEQQYEELLAAYKKESNPKTKERMLAVINVLVHGEAIPTVSRFFRKAYNSIKNWIRRFDENGIDALKNQDLDAVQKYPTIKLQNILQTN